LKKAKKEVNKNYEYIKIVDKLKKKEGFKISDNEELRKL